MTSKEESKYFIELINTLKNSKPEEIGGDKLFENIRQEFKSSQILNSAKVAAAIRNQQVDKQEYERLIETINKALVKTRERALINASDIVYKRGYGKLELSSEFAELLSKLAKEADTSESEIVKKGLILIGLVSKVRHQGFKLAVIDDDGSVIANVDGV